MTLNDLLRKAQALAMQCSSGDIQLIDEIDDNWYDIDLDLEIVQDSFSNEYYVKVIKIINYEQV